MLSLSVEDAAVARAEEARFLGMPIDRTAQVRTDRRKDGDILVTIARAANPDRMANFARLPAVLLSLFDRHQPPFPRLDDAQGPGVQKIRGRAGFARREET